MQPSFPNAPLVRRPALNFRNSKSHLLVQPALHSSAHQFSFFPLAIFLWNQLSNSVYDCETLLSFKHCVHTLYYIVDACCICSYICSVVSFVFLLFILHRLGTQYVSNFYMLFMYPCTTCKTITKKSSDTPQSY